MRSLWQASVFALVVLLAAGTIGKAQSTAGETQSCTNATLTGPYGYLLQGNLIEQGSLSPYADMGTLTADGKGNFSGTGTESFAGQIEQGTSLTGTYIVNTDCTGSASLTYGNGIGSFHFNLVVLNNGQDIRFMQTDSGSIVSGGARQQATNCVLESLNGAYAYTITGAFIDTNGNSNPYTDSGKITFNGTGSFSLGGEISDVGTVASLSVSGSYATHSNCTGTATFTDPNLGALSMNLTVVNGGVRFIDTDSGTIFSGTATALGDTGASGTMAHLASGAGWLTTFTLTNTGTTEANIQLSFFDDNGDAVALPLTFEDSGAKTTTANVSETIAPGATLVIATNANSNAALVQGSAELTSQGGNTSGFAVFHYNPNAQEAVVPLETRNAAAYVLAFDNTNGLTTGLALANISNQSVKVSMIVRDDTGAQLGTAPIDLAAHGHTSFLLANNYPFAKDKRGTVEFDAPSNGQISALGIRSAPTGSFTTIPALVK
jgi:hypothetical protein